ncbi:hypothetical protein B0A49_01379 [Cryomyces minteri]|uniref:Hyaluronan/mRNA-binding protein domain-containing protein n=1 Tax=Cryomyces minteri TaxID=331657 RepID=A0A4U0XTS6_9PEZI|nr:hypothetical protein B0A49_01379 [Cryomyces minteri]
MNHATAERLVDGETWKLGEGDAEERKECNGDWRSMYHLNDRDHAGLANGSAAPEEHLPRYFAKTGYADTDPQKTKKNGGGKGNWGREGDEIDHYAYNMTNPRRRSNSFSKAPGHNEFKTKFETIESDPVFEEELHGPTADDALDLEKQSTHSSSGSAEEEEAAPDKK